MEKYHSFSDVINRYSSSRSSIYRWIDDPSVNFPPPIKIGHRLLWRETDLVAFDERIAAR